MRGYGQYCPVAKAAEIVADRWTPLIIRELLEGMHRFNELERGLPGISRSLLAQRLRHLQHTGVVEQRPAGYFLTAAGEELQGVIDALGAWGSRRAFRDPEPAELDPVLLLWWMRRRVDFDALPDRRLVLQFDFRGARRHTAWLVIAAAAREVSVCLQHPGFEVDVVVRADLAAYYRVWLGRLALADAVRDGLVQLDGPPGLCRAFPRWFLGSPFAAPPTPPPLPTPAPPASA